MDEYGFSETVEDLIEGLKKFDTKLKIAFTVAKTNMLGDMTNFKHYTRCGGEYRTYPVETCKIINKNEDILLFILEDYIGFSNESK